MATLNFKGKSFVQNHHLAVKYHQLIPKKDKSLTDKVSLNGVPPILVPPRMRDFLLFSLVV